MGPRKSSGAERRKFPRKASKIKVKLEVVGSKGLVFEAFLPSADVSIGGVFLESEFFLKLGTELLVVFNLPDIPEVVRVKGFVVRQVRPSTGTKNLRTGFAIEFSEFVGDARIALASYFLAPTAREFVKKYMRKGRHSQIRDQNERLVDLIVAWEMDCLDRGVGRTIT